MENDEENDEQNHLFLSFFQQQTFEVRVINDHLYVDTELELSLTRDSDSQVGSQSKSMFLQFF